MKTFYSEVILGIVIISTSELIAVHLGPYQYLSHIKRGTLQEKIKSKLDKFFNRVLVPESSAGFTVPESLKDEKHGVKMGIASSFCDDGKTGVEIDWNESPVEYTCYNPKNPLSFLENVLPVEKCENVPSNYIPVHLCMNTKIVYNTTIPTYGDHRPLWPVYGDYQYVPPQRWLHTIEPLALVAWGCKLLMNHANKSTVVNFIKTRALHGPEGNYTKEGQYSLGLRDKAKLPIGSDEKDSHLCPGW
ncbi:uncharacterized protein LOC143253927 isoform X2 [Tachypleus tridentatus]|uniref:uncharacterized protein LOC143253927 isoform X2 n=1 Tax=Tachypleus tridentatus TaxID=6853 RepID=UPI003FD412F4